jgi:hypothetical protein
VELRRLGAGQGLLRGGGLLRQGLDGGEQRRRRVGAPRQGHRQAVLPRRQEPGQGVPQQGTPQAAEEQGRRRLPQRPPLPSLPDQHRPPAAAPDLLRRAGERPAGLRRHPAGAPEHVLPRVQLHIR